MDKLLIKIKKLIPKKLFRALQPAYHFFMSWVSSAFYRFPSSGLIVIGITGTTGKTTSVFLLAKMLESVGHKVGYTSTAMFSDGKREWLNDKKMTMVGRFFIQKMLRKMVRNKCEYAIVETTSEGIRQFRHSFINYDILVFTGLYPEHIDSHGGFENYKKAKGDLFAHLEKCKIKYFNKQRIKKIIIANGDDEYTDYFLDFWAEEKWEYTNNVNNLKKNGTQILYSKNIEAYRDGVNFLVNNTKFNLQLLGKFNVSNAMVSVCVGLSRGISLEDISKGLEKIKGVPGRLEKINEGQNFIVIVDYAFEPKAVGKLYEAIKLIPHKRVIHVLGSTGGGRDVSRRFALGELAGEHADIVIIANEDPYDDDPQEIIDGVAVGAIKKGKELDKDLFKILDRREAIERALAIAEENDIVLLTGKGSEQAICVANGEKIPWDDREVVREILNKK